ncbi:MAG: tyrosine-type recombinase/integrase [Bacteroidia bacterium]|nr:tyrosine-type recombinase/integrase [Bacteroidia bacterium]MCX7651600.1 tyrosine-type recombinase/integrase [Bacteroidia bacterium]MDW8417315.1 tyrosine-type recombinase/integrase [Bacteroidia bacterium]
MLERFLGYLEGIRRASKHTIEAYRRDLESWAEFCRKYHQFDPLESPETWRRATATQLRAWLSLYERANTRARKVAAIRRMDRFLHQVCGEKGLSWRPSSPRQPHSLPKALPEAQLMASLEALESLPADFSTIRDWLLIELMYGCGLRRSEAVQLRLSHIYREEIHILGKGNKWRVLPLYPRLIQLIERYLPMRNSLSPKHDFLLCTEKGAPLYPRAVHRIVRQRLGTHPHALRHSFATHLLMRGANVQAVRDLLGHETVATTQKYLALTPAEVKAAYKKFHPRA